MSQMFLLSKHYSFLNHLELLLNYNYLFCFAFILHFKIFNNLLFFILFNSKKKLKCLTVLMSTVIKF